MTGSFFIKGSTALHAIALTVAIALVSSNTNLNAGSITDRIPTPVFRAQPASDNVAIVPEVSSSIK